MWIRFNEQDLAAIMIDKTASVQGYYRKMSKKKASLLIRYLAAGYLLCVMIAWSQPAEAAKIQYKFRSWNGQVLKVFVTRPVGLAPDRPVVFILPGTGTDSSGYREQWHELAIEHDFLLVVPEFSQEGFPGADAINPQTSADVHGADRAGTDGSFSAIEAVFDDLRSRFHLSAKSYSIYGQSAGAELVHRTIFQLTRARVHRIVIANRGGYTLPDFERIFRSGPGASALDRDLLSHGLQLPVVVLLEQEDTNTGEGDQPLAAEAMAQRAQRLERGQAFFDSAQAAADELGIPFNWRLEIVRGVGRDSHLLAPLAIPFLLAVGPNP
jgi:hypothetical protein